jgi:CTP:molybdopterin cytidylyltransferase MocA/HD superfamily phosphohydrolase YqeK
MGEFKPLLPLDGVTAFERCIRLFRDAGVTEVIAVLGHRADELRSLAERCGARAVSNPQFEQGMFTSIVAGTRALPSWATGAFVLPADIPLVRAATVRQMSATFAKRQEGIVYPVFAGHRGHPPLISRSILAEAAQDGASGTLCSLLARHENSALDLPVADEAIHMDMDTPADYDALLALATRRDIPTTAECEAILAGQQVADSVIRHMRKVAEVAHRLAYVLACSGLDLNFEMVQAGALLHDLAKGQPDHASAGASILRTMEYPKVAEIVAAHTDLAPFSELDERAIVYLADKMVRGDEEVTITERFQPALDRFGNDPAALQAAQRRKHAAFEVALAIVARLRDPLSTAASAPSGSTVSPSGTRIANQSEYL